MVGWRQRLDRSRSPPRAAHVAWGWTLQICNWMGKWAWGRSKAVSICEDAAAKAKPDGELEKRIAQGARQNGHNAERLLESIVPTARLPPTIDVVGSEINTVVLPFDSFHWLRTLNPFKFERHLGAHSSGLEDWWRSLQSRSDGAELWNHNQYLVGRTPSDLKWYVPLIVFDDAGPCSNNDSAYARCYFSITGRGSDVETRILISTGLKNADLNDLSWPPIMASFDRLAGPIGDNGWGAILLFLGSDLEYAANVLGMVSYNSANCCAECDANGSTVPHNDFSDGALWRHTVRDNATYLAHFRQPLHPLVAHGWFNRFSYRHDILHMWDHHGITSTSVGCVLDHHVREASAVLPGNNQQIRLDFLNDDIRAFNSARGVLNKLPKLKLSNLTKDGFPDLHGQAVKAANTRSVIPYVVELQRRACVINATPLEKHMSKVVESLDVLYQLMYGVGYWFSADQLTLFNKHCKRIGSNWQLLAFITARDLVRSWPQRPKLHYTIAHLPRQAALINPRHVQSYASESMVGRVSTIYTASMDGPHKHLQSKVALKYWTGMLLAWTDGALP